MFWVFKFKSAVKVLVAIIAVITVTVTAAVGQSVTAANYGVRKLPVYGVDRGDKTVALTFDAAWGADKTDKILEILDEYGAKATFFLVGFWLDDYPDEVKKIDAAGHEIGNHSKNHLNMSGLDKSEQVKEITSVNEQIKNLTGKTPRFFRPPFGDYNNSLIESVEQQSMIAVQWSVDSLDWKGLSAAQIADRVLAKVTDGSIILCHNNSDHIVEALPLILIGLENKGYKPVTMSELVYTENYSIDNNGIQHLNNQGKQEE